jgi:hypothetical protein
VRKNINVFKRGGEIMTYYYYGYPTHQKQYYPHYPIQYVHPYDQRNGYTQPVMHTRPYMPYRQYPKVDTEAFHKSVKSFQSLLQEASDLLEKFATSDKFAYDLMSAAQKSDLPKVEEMIKSSGVSSLVDTKYTPDGIEITLSSKSGNVECCEMSMKLGW